MSDKKSESLVSTETLTSLAMLKVHRDHSKTTSIIYDLSSFRRLSFISRIP